MTNEALEEFLKNIKRDVCDNIAKYFFEFFASENIFLQLENFLNLKRVEYLSDHKFILKDTNKLIESFQKNQDFVKQMIYEHTFLNFAKEFHSLDSNNSYRFKNIMESVNQESKEKKSLKYYFQLDNG